MQPLLFMRIHILSDLHLEFASFSFPQIDSDVIILAGDTHVGVRGVEWAMDIAGNRPVLYLAGNHEYYGNKFPTLIATLIARLKERTKGSQVHILENDSVIINDVLFLGCTLWTDFKLGGREAIARYEAQMHMTDYRRIRVPPDYRRLTPADTAMRCIQSEHWLRDQCRMAPSIPRVIITHHAPSTRSLPARFAADILSAAYVSNFDELVETTRADLWIHGHIHTSCAYHIGKTQVICNPRGYPDENNTGFDATLAVDM
jgi:predicted phosphodiesterase